MNNPIKVLQFGEGNFLRAFVDYMIDEANLKGQFNGSVAIVKAIPFGSLKNFQEQNNKYTLITRGIINGEVVNESRQINSIADTACAYEDYNKFMSFARLNELQIIVSNTTEAGIVYGEMDKFEQCPPTTYPSKLTKFLFERYSYFSGNSDKGLYILPCELIENNGSKLEECVKKTIQNWNLPSGFLTWIENDCAFCSTLVDRIVTGYPKNDAAEIEQKLGYKDKLLDVCEPFALWVIEDKKDIKKLFPLNNAGLPVVFTKDVAPFRERKVRILNGAHTTTVLAGYLSGKKIVRECMQDEVISLFMKNCLYKEIIPTLTLDKNDLLAFSDAIFERFSNPYIDHSLLSISLNSVSKWKARVLGSFKDYVTINNELPKYIIFSFAALLAFYMGSELNKADSYVVCDDKDVLAYINNQNSLFSENKITLEDFVQSIASKQSFWGEDLSIYDGFSNTVTMYLKDILTNGAYNAMKDLVEEA
jgi:tagaturonate reductase